MSYFTKQATGYWQQCEVWKEKMKLADVEVRRNMMKILRQQELNKALLGTNATSVGTGIFEYIKRKSFSLTVEELIGKE